jgi:hypothetical protein
MLTLRKPLDPAADVAAVSMGVPVMKGEEAFCRLCWGPEEPQEHGKKSGEAGGDAGGTLIAPCKCSGSLAHIHRRCLAHWTRTRKEQGAGWLANTCELCRSPYNTTPDPDGCGDWLSDYEDPAAAAQRRRRRQHQNIIQAASVAWWQLLADISDTRRWPSAAIRVWKCWVLSTSMVRAGRGAVAETAVVD